MKERRAVKKVRKREMQPGRRDGKVGEEKKRRKEDGIWNDGKKLKLK